MYHVTVDELSLRQDEVGKFKEHVFVSRHRTLKAAYRMLASCIGGKRATKFKGKHCRYLICTPDMRLLTWSDARTELGMDIL